jgi:hypothetical protein
MPAGHAAGDTLLMFALTDDNSTPTAPTGWKFSSSTSAGASTTSLFRPRLSLFWTTDTGALGSSVSLSFSTASYPAGSPYVLACVLAYTGCDQSSPIGETGIVGTTDNSPTRAHMQLTSSLANDWLITIRGASSGSPAPTFTCSVGTDAERVDDNDGFPELAFAIYDSAAALPAGLQTQRSTTASRTSSWGSILGSVMLRPASTPAAAVAQAPAVTAAGTAYNASVTAVSGPWDACGTLPDYTFAIDWENSGSLASPGAVLTSNSYVRQGSTGWATGSGTLTWMSADQMRALGIKNLAMLHMVPNGTSATGGINSTPHTAVGSVVPGQTYVADGWVYSPAGWADMRAAIDWYDASDVFISTGGLATATVVPAGQFTRLTQSLIAPAGASRASVRIRHAGTPPATAHYYAWGVLLADPAVPGTYMAPSPGGDVTRDILDGGFPVEYGRDQTRQLSPTKIGSSSFSLNNTLRTYSPEYTAGPLFGDLDPARTMAGQVIFQGAAFPLGTRQIDDYNIHADRDNRTVDFSFLDGLKALDGVTLSTEVYQGQRTGDLINLILDLAGWTGGRDIDPGATIVPWWWAEGTSAFAAIEDLVSSEGPPSIAYVDLSNTFVFRDRHHRILRTRSSVSQATFAAKMVDCAAPAVTGLSFTPPFDYAHGWRDIVNTVDFDVSERSLSLFPSAVWTSDSSVSLGIGESYSVTVSGSDPFLNAIAPVAGTDYTLTGAGTVQVTLSRTSGQSATISILAIGGSVTLTGLQLRAQALSVTRVTRVSRSDTESVTSHGPRAYPSTVPWANTQDAYAIAGLILLHYAKRRPTVQLRVVASDAEHYVQILRRAVSDRIHLVNAEMGIDDDFFVEQITHTIERINPPGQPPVHSVVFGCEKDLTVISNPFRFDTRGAGFDQGVFDPISSDRAGTTFVFDDPVTGMFDIGLYGT